MGESHGFGTFFSGLGLILVGGPPTLLSPHLGCGRRGDHGGGNDGEGRKGLRSGR
jgi:hypothetical protein